MTKGISVSGPNKREIFQQVPIRRRGNADRELVKKASMSVSQWPWDERGGNVRGPTVPRRSLEEASAGGSKKLRKINFKTF